jgi:hypothetical protein
VYWGVGGWSIEGGKNQRNELGEELKKSSLHFAGFFCFWGILQKLKFIGNFETKSIYQIKSLSDNLQLIIFTLGIISILWIIGQSRHNSGVYG